MSTFLFFSIFATSNDSINEDLFLAKVAAGGGMTYISTPKLIQSEWDMMKNNKLDIAGFMNWSVDWDAVNIKDGDLSTGYTHEAWATGQTVQKTLSNENVVKI